jgi:hypothetical protein
VIARAGVVPLATKALIAIATCVATIATPRTANADAAEVEVDWASGLVKASGLGVADRHAPSPAAAREPARRAAIENATKKIAALLPTLPLASGGTLKAKLADKAIEARIARVLQAAIVVDSTPHTDGSWNLTLGVPIEAVRQAVAGPRAVTTTDADPPVVVVEGVTAKPAIGYTVGGVAGATLWVKEVPAWAKSAPRVKATTSTNGAIAVPIRVGSPKLGGPSTLYLITR